jgi:hypothetical protein
MNIACHMQSLKNDFNIGSFSFFDYLFNRQGYCMVAYPHMQYL